MIEPLRAAVRPRVRMSTSGEPVLLDEVIAELLAAGGAWAVRLCGVVGSGTHAALQHLAHEFLGEMRLKFELIAEANESPHDDPPGMIWIASDATVEYRSVSYHLAGWGRDEWIEYLLAAHHDRCASVMRRLQADADCGWLEGNPSLWRHVLDELAADESLPSMKAALQRVIDKMFPDPEPRRACGWRAFLSMTPEMSADSPEEPLPTGHTLSSEQLRLAKPAVFLMLAAEAVALKFADQQFDLILRRKWPKRLLDEVAMHVVGSAEIQQHLRQLIAPKHRELHSTTVSLLHACKVGWQPETSRLLGLRIGWLNLTNASCDEVNWPGIELSRCSLNRASFSGANLSRARLHGASAMHTNFDDADLSHAVLSRLAADSASFVSASLVRAYGRKVHLDRANLSFADLTEARLVHCNLSSANLSEAILCRAKLCSSMLVNAQIEGADFTEADLEDADLCGLDLTVACFDRVSFVRTNLFHCNLEGMELADANFAGANFTTALLTGSKFPRANLRGACLRAAGVAEIDWEQADLRNADLRGAAFHLGSTRDGLVGSTVPMHGSRTGFYTDDAIEQDFKSPEEIRKANLRGADLRGAKIDGVDFYLVDLREALYDTAQAVHFRNCGAILESKSDLL